MAQSSGPISQGTAAERQFTDVTWRDRFGDEPGVLSDMDGSSYALTLPSGSDIVSVGSTTQASLATVAGFVHRISAGSTEPITIPAASGSTRTDIIGLRYDPAYTGLPGPVRLYRTVGTNAAIPAYDSSPPGVEDLPLWAITRAVGQTLNLATVQRLFPRIAPTLDLGVSATLPTSSPLGTVVYQGNDVYRRVLNSSLVPIWQKDNAQTVGWTRTHQRAGGISGGIDTYTNTGLLLGDTWPNAPAGDYMLHVTLMLQSPSGNAAGVLSATMGNTVVSTSDARADVPTFSLLIHNTYVRENWGGGDLSYFVQHTAPAGVTINIHNASSKATLQYLGKR